MRKVDSRISFKLIRCLARTQTIKHFTTEEEPYVIQFLKENCTILQSTNNLCEDDTELITQGVLSLYHLVIPSVHSAQKFSTSILLSDTLHSCLRRLKKSTKDIESIAANFYKQLWHAANANKSAKNKGNESKEASEFAEKSILQFKKVALEILVHGGSSYWNHVVDKLVLCLQESSSSYLHVARSIFEEFSLYGSNHSTQDTVIVTFLLQVWTQMLFHSPAPSQHKEQTAKLKLLAKTSQEPKQISCLMNVVLALVGVSDEDVNIYLSKLKGCVVKDLEIALVRTALVALSSTSGSRSQTYEVKKERIQQLSSTTSLLLWFSQELDSFKSVVEVQMQMDLVGLKLGVLSRAGSLGYQLMKLDGTKFELCETYFRAVDRLLAENAIPEGKQLTSLLATTGSVFKCIAHAVFKINFCFPEVYAHNVATVLYQRSETQKSAEYFRKALDYLLSQHSLVEGSLSSEVTHSFSRNLA